MPGDSKKSKRILITGMSGTGKSSVLEELNRRGYVVIDADIDEWSEWRNVVSVDNNTPQPDWIWREDKMQAFLLQQHPSHVFISGCAPNQGKFYPMFNHVVLFTAPLDVMLERIRTRHNNPYGKSVEERNLIIHNTEVVVPILRSDCDLEIDTSRWTLPQIADKLASLASQ
jgi:shikimate kinase